MVEPRLLKMHQSLGACMDHKETYFDKKKRRSSSRNGFELSQQSDDENLCFNLEMPE